VHLVLATLQPREEAAQPAKVPLRDAAHDQVDLLRRQLRKRYVDRQAVVVGQREKFL
jgi:hypothetical protein